jgi:hypothetical protein
MAVIARAPVNAARYRMRAYMPPIGQGRFIVGAGLAVFLGRRKRFQKSRQKRFQKSKSGFLNQYTNHRFLTPYLPSSRPQFRVKSGDRQPLPRQSPGGHSIPRDSTTARTEGSARGLQGPSGTNGGPVSVEIEATTR